MNHSEATKLNFLLVEDVPADAELINYELRKAGIQFHTRIVAAKSDFLRELEDNPPDAIISDFSMPQFNALDALQLMRSRGTEIPFILVTGSQSEEVAVACIKEGADDYILKSSLKRLPTALLGSIQKKKAQREREQAEMALRQSEEYFRSLIDSSSDIIMLISDTGDIRFQSPSLEKSLGYKPEEFHGKSLFDYIHARDLRPVQEALSRELKRPSGERRVEYRFRHRDGGWRFLESIFKNLVENPAVGGIVISSRDITDRKTSDERIREQAALLNKAQDAILVLDLEENIQFWNQSAERIYGWKAEQVLGKKSAEFLYGESDPPQRETARTLTLRRGDWHGELTQRTADGRDIIMESRWSLVRDSEGKPKSFLIINSDVTEKKKLESHFLRAQRMESIGTLAGGIAHDLNNVLTPILMSLKLLRDYEDVPPDLVDTLETSAHRGASIVQQVLSFARGVEGERTILQVKHPLNEVIKIAKDIFPPVIQIKSKIERDLWPVEGDATQLHQVLMNLFVNARDAMPHGGRLQVEADNVQLDENYARMQPDAKAGAYVVISVSDTGSGIPPALLSKIFEPFFTTKAVGKGTGLGLSTAIGIVRSHGGFLTVYSEVGKGTCFKVYLPAAESSIATREVEQSRVVPSGKGETILVVDDEAAVREIVKVTLENNGYKVLTAGDGAEAVAVFARKKDIKAVVVDAMMPYMDGPATVRALQKLNPQTRFVAISGLMENDKVAQMSELSKVAFLAKPFTTEQILRTLDDLLSPETARKN